MISLDTAMGKAEQKIEYLSSDEETMRIYYERERSLHERENMVSSAQKRGKVSVKLWYNICGINFEGESI